MAISTSKGPAEPLGWQPGVAGVRGLDWEVGRRGGTRWRADLIWRHTLMAIVYARWRPVLWWRMRRVQPAVVSAVTGGPPSAHYPRSRPVPVALDGEETTDVPRR